MTIYLVSNMVRDVLFALYSFYRVTKRCKKLLPLKHLQNIKRTFTKNTFKHVQKFTLGNVNRQIHFELKRAYTGQPVPSAFIHFYAVLQLASFAFFSASFLICKLETHTYFPVLGQKGSRRYRLAVWSLATLTTTPA